MTLDIATILDVTGRSAHVAVVATLGIMPIATAAGYLLARRRGWWREALDILIMMPMVLPPVAVGLALMWMLAPQGPLGGLGMDLLLTWQAAAIAAAVVALPIATRGAEQAFLSAPPRLELLARALGHPRASVWRRVVWPHAGPGLIAAALMAFARALGEFGATVLVAGIIPGRTETLSLAIYDRINAGRDAEAWLFATIAALLAATALVAAHLCRRGLGTRGRAA
jgi:molybdate transport system permease protein